VGGRRNFLPENIKIKNIPFTVIYKIIQTNSKFVFVDYILWYDKLPVPIILHIYYYYFILVIYKVWYTTQNQTTFG